MKGIITGEICYITGHVSSCLHPQCLNVPASVTKDMFPPSTKKLINSNNTFYLQMESFSRSSWKPTTPTGRSTMLHQWPSATSWQLRLRNGPITCCQVAPCSTAAPRMGRTSTIWALHQPLNLQVDSRPNSFLFCPSIKSFWFQHLPSHSVKLSKKNHVSQLVQMFISYSFHAFVSLDHVSGKEAVDSWYSEIKDYSWSSPGFKSNTGKTKPTWGVP